MREDFHRVLIERARGNSRAKSAKRGYALSSYDPEREDDFLSRESPEARYAQPTKYFSDHLSPLIRFLDKQVGRPWRKVEGEVRKAIDTRTLIGRHLWTHLEQMVERSVVIRADGEPRRLVGDRPIWYFYVHPRSGLLKKGPPGHRRDQVEPRKLRIEKATEVDLDARTRAEKIDGLWYLFVRTGKVEIVRILRRGVAEYEERPKILKKQASRGEILRIRAALEAGIR